VEKEWAIFLAKSIGGPTDCIWRYKIAGSVKIQCLCIALTIIPCFMTEWINVGIYSWSSVISAKFNTTPFWSNDSKVIPTGTTDRLLRHCTGTVKFLCKVTEQTPWFILHWPFRMLANRFPIEYRSFTVVPPYLLTKYVSIFF